MKYTIIALLFIGTAYGQDTIETVYPIWVIDTTGQYNLKTPEPSTLIFRQIADAYDKYVASLRKNYDQEISLQIGFVTRHNAEVSIYYYGKDTTVFEYKGGWKFMPDAWIIRQRPTLEGFMDYLRSK